MGSSSSRAGYMHGTEGVSVISVTVEPSGEKKEFSVPEKGAPCDVVARLLKREFGPGTLNLTGSRLILLPLKCVPLQAGDYEYRPFAVTAKGGGGANAETKARPQRQPAAPGVSQFGSLSDGKLYVDVLMEHGNARVTAKLFVDTGCDLPLKLSDIKADQLGLEPDSYSALLERGQGHSGKVLLRCILRTAVLLEGDDDETIKDARRTTYLEVYTDEGTKKPSCLCDSKGRSSSSNKNSSKNEVLKITVLSQIKQGENSQGRDAILGALGMGLLKLGIDKNTMRLYRKPPPKHFLKRGRRR